MDSPKSKILLVDDEKAVLLTVEAILRQEGYDVDAVSGGAAAIQAIRERRYDLVLTDLKMPGPDGLAVLSEVRKRSPDTVTIMMTGYGSLDSALEAVQLGAYEYLLKPTGVPELKMAVRRSLERKRLSEIDTLYRITTNLAGSLSSDRIVPELSEAVKRVLGVAHACVIPLGNDLPPTNCPEQLVDAVKGRKVLAKLGSGEVITSAAGFSCLSKWTESQAIQSFVCVPGHAGQKLVCLVYADNGGEHFDFHASAQRFLRALASQAAMALSNASLLTELRTNNRELEQANQKLRDLDKLKSQFLSIATHELRTPISVILGYNSMLAEGLQDRLTADEQETLRESIAACKRLIRLVNSMLDITQIESGRMRMNFHRADLRQVVHSVASLFHHEARARNIALRVEVPSQLPSILIDTERIQQVLINLVGNALKFTGEGGQIAVAVRPSSETDCVEVSVRDTGVGISPADQARIFHEFEQVRQPGAGAHDGAGLGLAIARRIVEAHEGNIRVISSLGEGSCFTFQLPLHTRLNTAVSA